MATTIKLKNGSGAPTSGDLVQGEPALDLTNKRLYTEDSGGNVIEVGTNPTEITTGDITATGTTTISTADINGGTIDNTTIGGTTPAAGTFTTGQFNTSLNVDGTVTADGLTVENASDATITLTDTSNSVSTVLESRNTTASVGTSSAHDFQIRTDDTQRIRLLSNGDISFYEDTGTTPKFFWDASEESLGIGTSSPDLAITINKAGQGLRILSDVNSDGFDFGVRNDNGDAQLIQRKEGADLRFFTTPNGGSVSERMRIDSSGNLLVGKSNIAFGPTGIDLEGSQGRIRVTGSDYTGLFNRIDSDGDIVQFRKDGSTVGSITACAGDIRVGTGNTGFRFHDGSDQIRPAGYTGADRDNAIDLGSSSARFDDIYITGGVIDTSDRNEKQDIEELSEAEQRVAQACKGLLKKFRWIHAVEKKDNNPDSDEEARIHFGIIAQDLKAAFEAEGLDAGRYAMFISSTWWETQTEVPAVEAQDAVYETVTDEGGNETQVLVSEAVEAKEAYTRTDTYETEEEAPEGAVKRTRMGVRYSELLAFIIAAI